jgi:hypothetical protein
MAHDSRTRGREQAMSQLIGTVSVDPRIIPGVHHYCDEWCDMCPVTARCLSYRSLAVYRKAHGRREGEPTFENAADSIAFTRAVAAAEGRAAGGPAGDSKPASTAVGISDPLADAAWHYAVGVSMWLVLTPEELRRMRNGRTPSPEEVVLWHHLRIYIRLVRALSARLRQSEVKGQEQVKGTDEVNGSAKVALVSVQRSRKALFQLSKTPAADTASSLVRTLDAVERGIDQRFPRARTFVRVGLDAPAA